MPVTKEMLRAMLETLGGLDMTDEELEKVAVNDSVVDHSPFGIFHVQVLRAGFFWSILGLLRGSALPKKKQYTVPEAEVVPLRNLEQKM